MFNEIGGFIELELKKKKLFHKNAKYLNSARNGIRYLIRSYKIKKLHVPYYTCPVVWQAIEAENCRIIPYNINLDLMPVSSFEENDYILYTNYFGICTKNIKILAQKYKNIIIDNAMAFFAPYFGIGSVYSPRKFFGVADGGIVISDSNLEIALEKDTSYQRFSHLLKRVDCGSNFAYEDFNKNDNSLINEPIKKMSNLTYKMLENIDYKESAKKRLKNFKYLKKCLHKINLLKINIEQADVPMYYPLLLNNSEKVRNELLNSCIYCPKPWRGLEDLYGNNNCENEKILYKNLIPLIIDQRYGIEEMNKIINIIMRNM